MVVRRYSLTLILKFDQVCGTIIAYQFGSTNSFLFGHTIDEGYVDGISLTHSAIPRKHIWSFAAALDEYVSTNAKYKCPCTNINRASDATPCTP